MSDFHLLDASSDDESRISSDIRRLYCGDLQLITGIEYGG